MKPIREISSLRIIFILMIFFHHTVNYTGGGYLGVEFFFILSGFVMTLGYKDRITGDGFSYGRYIARRAAKFYPLHWLCLLAVVALEVARRKFTAASLVPLAFNAALLQSWVPVKDVYFSFNAPTWFLCNILFFAGIFPFLLKGILALWKSKRNTILAAVALLIGYIVLCISVKGESRHYILYVNPAVRLVDFIIGIYTALIFMQLKAKESKMESLRVPLKAAMYSCIPLLLVLSFLVPENYLMCSLIMAPLICLLLVTVSLPPVGGKSAFSWAPLVKLGECSFEFYMIHKVCIRYFYYVNEALGVSSMYVYVPVFLILITALALLCRKFFVVPVSRFLVKSPA